MLILDKRAILGRNPVLWTVYAATGSRILGIDVSVQLGIG